VNRRTIKLVGERQRQHAIQCVADAPLGYCVAIGEQTRSQEQNALMWPLISDIQKQVPEAATFSADDMKLRFIHALGQEMRFLPELEGAGMFPVGQRSSTLSKTQFSALLEIIFAYGARHGVRWSAKSLETIESAK
jgi:hypothetical protein